MGFLNPVFAGYAATQAKMRHFDRPCGTDQLSLKLPGTSYRATFAASLRDRSLSNLHRTTGLLSWARPRRRARKFDTSLQRAKQKIA